MFSSSTDLNTAATSAALETFSARAEGADWALICYAGHGLEPLIRTPGD
jgi:uncharacterized caspase-like protein